MVAVRNEKAAAVDKVYELREVRESPCCSAIQDAPRLLRGAVRWITLGYPETVGSQFLSFRQSTGPHLLLARADEVIE